MIVKTAKVAVSGVIFAIDKPYSYKIPDLLIEKVSAGTRVIVPFSFNNRRVEGMVLSVTEEDDSPRLKAIVSLLDDEPIINEAQLQLALWMRERYFCTFYDCIRAILPAGVWYTLKQGYKFANISVEDIIKQFCGDDNAIAVVNALYDSGGECLESKLISLAGLSNDSFKTAIKTLTTADVLIPTTQETRKIKDKVTAVATLGLTYEDAVEQVNARRRRAPMQSAVIELLLSIGAAPVKEICYFTGAAMQTIKALERAEIISLDYIETFRRPKYGRETEIAPFKLSEEQKKAYDSLCELLKCENAAVTLLKGVTGSGKTIVYIKLIEKCIELGQSAIVLVPEIALTPQLLSTFGSYFGDSIALLHSSLGIGERYDEWKRIRSGVVKVVVGTRSAVFAPISKLGLIIIDEEQEHTYKSENTPRYHTVDIAKYRCMQSKSLLVLGSATPSVQSSYNVQCGKYHGFTLKSRYNNEELPRVIIADMKKELRNGNGSTLSLDLTKEIEKNIAAGEQSILFINRRGTSNIVACPECGFTYSCPNCSVSLTYHQANRRLLCHYCGYSQKMEESCPECSGQLKFIGAGTQKVCEDISEKFPDVPLLRMDADTLSTINTHEVIFERFEKERIPILVGTQMVAKGLNFENVTLVGVISVDQSLYASDYRAHERTFSMITQVVGRSGRGDKPGRAVLQTLTPENEIIKLAAQQDYDKFLELELTKRRTLNAPPVADMIVFTVSGAEHDGVLYAVARLRRTLEERAPEDIFKILGPVPAVVLKLNNRFRYELTLIGKNNKKNREFTAQMLKMFNAQKENKGLHISADVNPLE